MLKTITLRDGATLALSVDDFTDPWGACESVLFIHGNSESGRAWDRWVPSFARDFRIVRPDLRGFGDSQAMLQDHAWTLDELSDDLTRVIDDLGLAKVHVVGAKLGGLIAMHFAAHHADRAASLCVVGSPISGSALTQGQTPTQEILEGGVIAWARRTMAARLGPALPAEAHAYWADYMGHTATSTQLGFLRDLAGFDMAADLARIVCPALVFATREDTLVGSVESTRAWQRRIPNSTLEVIDASGYHAALTEADRLAPRAAAFARLHGSAPTD